MNLAREHIPCVISRSDQADAQITVNEVVETDILLLSTLTSDQIQKLKITQYHKRSKE